MYVLSVGQYIQPLESLGRGSFVFCMATSAEQVSLDRVLSFQTTVYTSRIYWSRVKQNIEYIEYIL